MILSIRMLIYFLLPLIIIFLFAWIMYMPGRSYRGKLPELNEEQKKQQQRLKAHVEMLADSIGERNMFNYENLIAAADYIEATLKQMGYPLSRISYDLLNQKPYSIQVEIPGTSKADEIVVIGAHYDSVKGSYGGNDNGTGVSALLEIAEEFVGVKSNRTLRLVFFVNEEPPFFLSKYMGSSVYAKRAKEKNENIVAMLSLETLGYYSDEKGTQKYPFPFMFFYPSKGNFIVFIGNMSSRSLVTKTLACFRKHAAFPSEGASAPGWIPGVYFSDQWSFWKEGYPAVMVTDTALFRYPHYHTYEDTSDKVDYARLTLVTDGLKPVVKCLCN